MEKNVEEFVEKCAKQLGENQSAFFMAELEMLEDEGYGMWSEGVTSPIEQILFAAILHNIKVNDVAIAEPDVIDRFDIINGINIKPQFKVGKYRVDFKVENSKLIYSQKKQRIIADDSRSVLVECDSQRWHERAEKERRYEKTRDRYFAKHNLKIFHYTGKEIINRPYEIAAEILHEVLGYDCSPV